MFTYGFAGILGCLDDLDCFEGFPDPETDFILSDKKSLGSESPSFDDSKAILSGTDSFPDLLFIFSSLETESLSKINY